MTRTFRGSVSDPKCTTTDSRSQLKNTTVSNLDSPSLRRKRVRSKNTGRLEFVDHDHEFVESASMRGVRPKREGVGVGLPPPPGVKVSRVSEETEEAPEKKNFTLHGSSTEKEQHHTPPRTTNQPATSPIPVGTPVEVASSRAASAIATASAYGQTVGAKATLIRVRAAGAEF